VTPRRPRPLVLLAAVLALVLAIASACGDTDPAPSADAPSADAPSEDPTSWRDIELTDVEGESFTIAELAGGPVLVENFATWCSNCLRQLGDTQRAAAEAGEAATFVALSVETDLDPAEVRAYAAEHGFDDIRFAVMTPEMLAAMQDAFGTTALNPPSTPKVVVAEDGTVGELSTGFESPEEIAAKLTGSG